MAYQDLEILINAKDLATKVINQVEKEIKGLQTTTSKMNRKIQDMQPAFKKMAVVGTTAFAGIGLGIKNITDNASDLVEINQKFGVVYSDMEKEATKTAKGLADGYGLAKSSARGYLADIGDLVSGLGYTQEASLDFGNTVVSLGSDLASFSNVAGGSEEAIDKLKKGLLGEHENLKALGIQVNENMVKTQLLADGTDKLTGKALMQAKVEARLKLALDQSKNAIGDYARSKGSLANKTKEAQAKVQDLKDTLGQAFYPIVLQITKAIIPLVEKFSNWASENEQLVKWIGIAALGITAFIATAGLLGLALPAVIAGIGLMTTAVTGLASAFMFLAANPIGLLITAIVALGVVIYKFYEDWDNITLTVKYLWGLMTDSIVEKAVWFKDTLIGIWEAIKSALFGIVNDIVTVVKDKFQGLADFVTGIFDKITGLYSKAKALASKAKSLAGGAVTSVTNFVSGAKATGGTVASGRTYLVGERGPELYTAPGAGNITPNNQLGGSNQTVNINVTGNNISNEADENRLVEKIKDSLARDISLATNFGIA